MKRRILASRAPLAGVLSIVLSAGAFAADSANPVIPPNPGPNGVVESEAAAEAAQRIEPSEVAVDELVGRRVLSENDEDIGDINAVILAKEGEVNAVVLGVGGFLGMGEKEVAVPWNRITLGENGHRVTLNMTRQELEQLPAYAYPDNQRPRTAFLDPDYRGQQEARAARPASPKPETGATVDRSAVGGKPPADRGWSRAVDGDGKIRSGSFVGTEVMNDDNEAIGEIEDILIAQGGEPQLLVSVGGFLGIGERLVVLDWDQLSIDRNNESVRVAVNLSRQQLERLPPYQE